MAIDGRAVEVRVTLRIGADNLLSGAAPCNRYSGINRAVLPALELGPLRVTRMACPELAEEQMYLDALARMTNVAIKAGCTLVLTDPDGHSMTFVPDGTDFRPEAPND